jgi:tRNA(Leu) C34 or U34 (ribose-2'-O)-methylase TrmL
VTRGFAAIALDNPKSGENVGGALRAAHCFNASLVVVGGPRRITLLKHQTNVTKAWRHIPTLWVESVFDALPFDCVPVAVEFLPNATPLPDFVHPERAFYVFGAEDATLGARVLDRCARAIVVPTAYCLNLAMTVGVVLYDREAKRREVSLPQARAA